MLHPLTDRDFREVKKDETFSAPVHGYWMSDYYINEVMQVKIEASK